MNASNWVKHHSCDKLTVLGYDHIEHRHLILYLKKHNMNLNSLLYTYACMHALLIPVIVVAISIGHIMHILLVYRYMMKGGETMHEERKLDCSQCQTVRQHVDD